MSLSISEVAASTALRPSALRYYEQAGLITAAFRSAGRRHYDPGVLPRLSFIALCQQTGFTIAEIRQLLDAGPHSKHGWREVAEEKLKEIDLKMARLQDMRAHLELALTCDCDRVEACRLVADAAARRQSRIGDCDRRSTGAEPATF